MVCRSAAVLPNEWRAAVRRDCQTSGVRQCAVLPNEWRAAVRRRCSTGRCIVLLVPCLRVGGREVGAGFRIQGCLMPWLLLPGGGSHPSPHASLAQPGSTPPAGPHAWTPPAMHRPPPPHTHTQRLSFPHLDVRLQLRQHVKHRAERAQMKLVGEALDDTLHEHRARVQLVRHAVQLAQRGYDQPQFSDEFASHAPHSLPVSLICLLSASKCVPASDSKSAQSRQQHQPGAMAKKPQRQGACSIHQAQVAKQQHTYRLSHTPTPPHLRLLPLSLALLAVAQTVLLLPLRFALLAVARTALVLHAHPQLVHLNEIGQQEVDSVVDIAAAIAFVLAASVRKEALDIIHRCGKDSGCRHADGGDRCGQCLCCRCQRPAVGPGCRESDVWTDGTGGTGVWMCGQRELTLAATAHLKSCRRLEP
eukprot:364821-Chlamydomonas_euryale.AAC.20